MIVSIPLTAKEIHVIIQAIRIASEDGSLEDYAKPKEIDVIREKLQKVK